MYYVLHLFEFVLKILVSFLGVKFLLFKLLDTFIKFFIFQKFILDRFNFRFRFDLLIMWYSIKVLLVFKFEFWNKLIIFLSQIFIQNRLNLNIFLFRLINFIRNVFIQNILNLYKFRLRLLKLMWQIVLCANLYKCRLWLIKLMWQIVLCVNLYKFLFRLINLIR